MSYIDTQLVRKPYQEVGPLVQTRFDIYCGEGTFLPLSFSLFLKIYMFMCLNEFFHYNLLQ